MSVVTPKRRFTQLPFSMVLLVVAVAAVRITQFHWRQGTALIAGALVIGAVLRAVLPEEKAGLLAIRGKAVDLMTYSGLAIVMLFLTFTITGGPLDAA